MFVVGGLLIGAGLVGLAILFWPAAAIGFGIALAATAADMRTETPS